MRRARGSLTLALVIVTVALSAAPAWAHAAYKSSDPPDDGQVSTPPSEVTATFTEPLADGSFLQVTDPCGDRVDGGDVRIVGYDMSVSMSAVAQGRYTVFYRAFSTLDPHVTEGTFGFTSTGGEACAGQEPADRSEPKDGGFRPTDQNSGREESSSASGRTDGGASHAGGGAARHGGAHGSALKGTDGRLTGKDEPGRAARDVEEEDVRLTAEEAESPSVWDGIRLEPFLMGLLLAAIIGAAGGKMYAGIMGPRA